MELTPSGATDSFRLESQFSPPGFSLTAAKNSISTRADRRIQVVLPLRVTCYDSGKKPSLIMVCSYDISARGAKIGGIRNGLKTGEIVAVERGRSKVFCRVVWVGESGSQRQGQIGIECTDPAKAMWENELRELNVAYDPLPVRGNPVLELQAGSRERERRRDPRAKAEGWAELVATRSSVNASLADLHDISEFGCRVISRHPLSRGMRLDLTLNIGNFELKLKGQVRHVLDLAVGIEFREVRKGDRQILQHLLRKLTEQQLEECFQLDLKA